MTPRRFARPMTGLPAWAWPRGCPARTSRTSCSSTPSGPAPPWSGTTSSGPRPEGRSARASTVSRSSLFRPGRAHSARTRTRTSLDRPGTRPTGLPTSGTCPRPPGRPSATTPPARRDPPAGVWDALCWLARRQGYAVELEHGPPPTAPCSGPSAVSASRPGSAASRPCGHWHTSSATCCCTMTPATRRDHHHRLRRRAQSRSRLGRLDHLRPPRHHPRRRPALPGQLDRHRPARPARCRHPRRRAPHHRSRNPYHPPHQPHPARRPRPGPPRPPRARRASRQPRHRPAGHRLDHPEFRGDFDYPQMLWSGWAVVFHGTAA